MSPERKVVPRWAWLAVGAVLAFTGGAGLVAALAPADGSVASGVSAPAEPPAPLAPRIEATPVPAAPSASAAPRSVDPEEEGTERLRVAVDEQPQVGLALADQLDATFPSGAHADERAYLRMRALVHLGDIGKARTVAGEFFDRHPGSPLSRSVFRLTGMRPRPIGPPS